MARRSNLDKTGMRLVKKGCTVRYGVNRGKVLKVSRGACIVAWWGNTDRKTPEYCERLEVVV